MEWYSMFGFYFDIPQILQDDFEKFLIFEPKYENNEGISLQCSKNN